jgi:hypothetical protein
LPVATRDVLERLGFTTYQADFADEQPGYQYNFGNLLLKAVQHNDLSMRRVMQFSGHMTTRNRFGVIDFSLPLEVVSFEQGVALIAHYLGRKFTPIRPTPWLELGREWEDLLPWRMKQILYDNRPTCHADADWFRVAVKKLVACGELADGSQQFEVSCIGGILKFKMDDQTVALPVNAADWPESYIGRTKLLARISKRTPSQGVPISVWEGRLIIGRISLELSGEIGCGVNNQTLVE